MYTLFKLCVCYQVTYIIYHCSIVIEARLQNCAPEELNCSFVLVRVSHVKLLLYA